MPSQIEAKLTATLDVLLKLAMTVHDFQPESSAVLARRINSLARCLADLDNLKDSVDIQVPLSLLDVVENGHNPDLFVRDLVQSLVDKNQKTNGRIKSIQMLKEELESQLDHNGFHVHEENGTTQSSS